MSKIPFDIKYRSQIESGEYKVFLENGNPVRILAWDLPGDYPIAAADWPSDDETDTRVETYTEDGWDGIGQKSATLMVETKFIKLPLDLLREWSMRFSPGIRDMIEDTAYHFWDLAISERQAEIEFRGEEYKQGYEDGKSEAEKDLPRWKTVEKVGNISIKEPYIITNMIGEKTLYIGLKGISIHSLEKLPGFKEGK